MNRILTIVLASALLCAPALADTLGEMRAKYGITRGFNASDKPVPNFTSGLQISGSDLTVGEFGVLDGVTAGTTTASKALVVDADKKLDGGILSRLLASNVANSTAIGGTGANVEANFSNGSYTIPAASLVAGDVIRVRAYITVPDTISTDTLRIYVNVGGISGTAIYDSGAINVSDSDMFLIDATVSLWTVGASGTFASVVTSQSTQATTFAVRAPQVTGASVDTTASIALTVSAVWSTENANSCSLAQFIVTKN